MPFDSLDRYEQYLAVIICERMLRCEVDGTAKGNDASMRPKRCCLIKQCLEATRRSLGHQCGIEEYS